MERRLSAIVVSVARTGPDRGAREKETKRKGEEEGEGLERQNSAERARERELSTHGAEGEYP